MQTILWGSMGPDSHSVDTAFERAVGKRQSLVHLAQAWAYGKKSDGTPNYAPFPAQPIGSWSYLRQPYANGQLALLDWASWDLTVGTSTLDPLFTLDTIIAGAHDAFLTVWARDARAFGQPILIRFNSEMNGAWWANYGAQPEKFVKAWRHVVGIFKNEHADNVAWNWCINYTSPPGAVFPTSADKAGSYYPGDDVVDWTGFDTYNESMSRVVLDANGKMVSGWVVPWLSPAQVLNGAWTPGVAPYSWIGPTYDTLLKIAPTKPICIGEINSDDRPSTAPESSSLLGNGNRPAWLLELLTTVPKQFPAIRALSFFNWNAEPTTHWALKPADYVMMTGALASPVYLAAGDWLPGQGQPLRAPSATVTLSGPLPSEFGKNGWTTWEEAARGLADHSAATDAALGAAQGQLDAIKGGIQALRQLDTSG